MFRKKTLFILIMAFLMASCKQGTESGNGATFDVRVGVECPDVACTGILPTAYVGAYLNNDPRSCLEELGLERLNNLSSIFSQGFDYHSEITLQDDVGGMQLIGVAFEWFDSEGVKATPTENGLSLCVVVDNNKNGILDLGDSIGEALDLFTVDQSCKSVTGDLDSCVADNFENIE